MVSNLTTMLERLLGSAFTCSPGVSAPLADLIGSTLDGSDPWWWCSMTSPLASCLYSSRNGFASTCSRSRAPAAMFATFFGGERGGRAPLAPLALPISSLPTPPTSPPRCDGDHEHSVVLPRHRGRWNWAGRAISALAILAVISVITIAPQLDLVRLSQVSRDRRPAVPTVTPHASDVTPRAGSFAPSVENGDAGPSLSLLSYLEAHFGPPASSPYHVWITLADSTWASTGTAALHTFVERLNVDRRAAYGSRRGGIKDTKLVVLALDEQAIDIVGRYTDANGLVDKGGYAYGGYLFNKPEQVRSFFYRRVLGLPADILPICSYCMSAVVPINREGSDSCRSTSHRSNATWPKLASQSGPASSNSRGKQRRSSPSIHRLHRSDPAPGPVLRRFRRFLPTVSRLPRSVVIGARSYPLTRARRSDPYPHMESYMEGSYDLIGSENHAWSHINTGEHFDEPVCLTTADLRQAGSGCGSRKLLRTHGMRCSGKICRVARGTRSVSTRCASWYFTGCRNSSDLYAKSRRAQILNTEPRRQWGDGRDQLAEPARSDFVGRSGIRVHVLDDNLFRAHHFDFGRPFAGRDRSVYLHMTCGDDTPTKIYMAKAQVRTPLAVHERKRWLNRIPSGFLARS